ncbi:class I SAM-dependent methyltransferase [Paraburkholderia nemoris]|uniref:class I SAM-dependent methyltransferase n=1 Tax=Paraburkholderia nemoris TaxID=2793076 RepID=UPI0038B91345
MNDKNFNAQFGQAMSPEQYAEQWASASAYFADSGQYAWMNEQLGAAESVLEIGCGSGLSTLSLAKTHKVVALDVNESLLTKAEKRLADAGVSVEIVQPADLNQPSNASVRLVKGNIFNDSVFVSIASVPFDAIVCWMIGASPEIVVEATGTSVKDFDGTEPATYRSLVHRRCYELGRDCLKPGGIVQMVDRFVIRSWADKDPFRDQHAAMHVELAGAGYKISKAGTFFRKLDDLGKSEIQYMASARTSGIKVLGSVKAIRV